MNMARMEIEELDNVDRVWHLSQSGLVDGLSLVDLNAVASACKDRIYAKGEVIFDQGDFAHSLYILNRGCVRTSLTNPDDRERILDFHTIGILGENTLAPKQLFQVRATAHEESWISVISRDQLINLIRQRTSIAMNYVKILSQRLLEAREDIKSHTFLDTRHRLARILLKLADQHGKPIPGNDEMVKLRIPVSHEHLARMIGANRPHLSMMMSRFRKRGWVNYQNRKLLIKRSALESLTHPPGNGDVIQTRFL